MNEYKILYYNIYEEPVNPTANGKYFGKTPILEQAKAIVDNAKKQNKKLFIKAICDDGIERYI